MTALNRSQAEALRALALGLTYASWMRRRSAFRPRRGQRTEPRATPWDQGQPTNLSPERAAEYPRAPSSCRPFRAGRRRPPLSQGVALGFDVLPLQGKASASSTLNLRVSDVRATASSSVFGLIGSAQSTARSSGTQVVNPNIQACCCTSRHGLDDLWPTAGAPKTLCSAAILSRPGATEQGRRSTLPVGSRLNAKRESRSRAHSAQGGYAS